jgi:hypothetical protein
MLRNLFSLGSILRHKVSRTEKTYLGIISVHRVSLDVRFVNISLEIEAR